MTHGGTAVRRAIIRSSSHLEFEVIRAATLLEMSHESTSR